MKRALAAGEGWNDALARILEWFDADSGTIHLLGSDGVLHLKAASAGIPQFVLDTVREVPIGKGMAGLAVERKEPVNSCNIQTDTTGDVRPGARATGLQGSIVVPILRGDAAIGALGIANQRERTFTDDEAARLLEVGRVLARLSD
jgi:L-methionine (R)-S-oxide reductase